MFALFTGTGWSVLEMCIGTGCLYWGCVQALIDTMISSLYFDFCYVIPQNKLAYMRLCIYEIFDDWVQRDSVHFQ